MEISASQVKELREKTGAGMMDCKKALTEAAGDFEKAIENLRKKGIAAAAKKAGRATKEGAVHSYILNDNRTGVLLEINCETDFVARTEQFRGFVQDIAAHIAQAKPASMEQLMGQPYVKDRSKNVDQVLREAIATLGENMGINRFVLQEVPSDAKGYVGTYIHGEGKVGVLVEFALGGADLAGKEAFRTYAKDIAMHIAAAAPQWVRSSEIPAETIAKEKEIAIAQMANSGKPQNVLEKIAEGKLKKFYEDTCLINQAFVKDPEKTIEKLTQETSKALGQDLAVRRFTRYVLGETRKEAEATQ